VVPSAWGWLSPCGPRPWRVRPSSRRQSHRSVPRHLCRPPPPLRRHPTRHRPYASRLRLHLRSRSLATSTSRACCESVSTTRPRHCLRRRRLWPPRTSPSSTSRRPSAPGVAPSPASGMHSRHLRQRSLLSPPPGSTWRAWRTTTPSTSAGVPSLPPSRPSTPRCWPTHRSRSSGWAGTPTTHSDRRASTSTARSLPPSAPPPQTRTPPPIRPANGPQPTIPQAPPTRSTRLGCSALSRRPTGLPMWWSSTCTGGCKARGARAARSGPWRRTLSTPAPTSSSAATPTSSKVTDDWVTAMSRTGSETTPGTRRARRRRRLSPGC